MDVELTGFVGGIALQTYRIIFCKKGDSKYLSHLDLMRCFTRAVKRTGCKAWYTEGFNPHLYLMFISPLSLGFESDYEAVDIRLDENTDIDEFIKKINEALPKGIQVLSVAVANCSYKEIGYSSWLINIKNSDYIISKENILDFIDQEHIYVTKKNKKGAERQEDIKQYIKSISIELENNNIIINAVFVTDLSVALNPQLFLSGLWNYLSIENIPDVSITRKMLLDINGKKME
ncbi:MAG: TIGR03936 family radical SAM-associated protein [Oscillospiraceae bacterium]|nr:TIGR03936 family radical SAM-associated protein [Oscillospiraceae bacterium]